MNQAPNHAMQLVLVRPIPPMCSKRYSSDLERRYQACDHGATLQTKWPVACGGAANAFLVLLGPSMGAADRGQVAERGGPNRPDGYTMSIGRAVMDFEGLGRRNRRWSRLCAEMLGGEHYVTSMTALLNLDWRNSSSERDIPKADLISGFRDYIWPLLNKLRPRIICALTRRVWDTAAPELEQHRVPFPECPITLPLAPIIFRLPKSDFPTMLIKSHNHPSRALSYAHISILGQVCTWFLKQPQEA